MSRRVLLGLIVAVAVGIVAGLVAATGPTTLSASAELNTLDARTDERDSRRWADREIQRLDHYGAALLTASREIDHEVDLDLGRSSVVITVTSDESVDVVALANDYLLVVGADFVRRSNNVHHLSIRAAELAVGIPGPPDPERPNDPLEAPSAEEPTLDGLDRLRRVRSDALIGLETDAIQAAEGPFEDQPSPIRDGLLAGALAAFALLGGSGLHRYGRSSAPRTPLTSFDSLPGASALGIVIGWMLVAQVLSRTPVPQAVFGLLVGATGVVLARRRISYGAVFAMWMWVLTPLAERVSLWADIESSTVLIKAAPVLASLALVPAVVAAGWPNGRLGSFLRWLLPIAIVGMAVGLDENGVIAAALSAASLGAPAFVVVAAHRTIGVAELRHASVGFLRGAAFISALYALVQWSLLPPWDEQWLVTNFIRSFGTAEVFSFRVFGPLSSPAALATLLVAAIVVSIGDGKARTPTTALCSIGLLLTLHRASWVALLVSVIVIGLFGRWTLRTIAAGLGVAAATIGLMAFAVRGVRDRFSGLSAGLADSSLASRIDNHANVIPSLDDRLFGRGFGSVGAGARYSDNTDLVNDSAVLDLLVTLGVVLALGLIALMAVWWWRLRPAERSGPLPIAGWALLTGFAAVAPLLGIFEDPIGLWVALAVLLATNSGQPGPGELEPVAIVHDQLIQRGGAERVVVTLSCQFPDAPIVTTLFEPEKTFPDIASSDLHTVSPIPARAIGRYHRHALPYLAALWALTTVHAKTVICSSSAGSHLVRVPSGRQFVYCHTPPRWLYGFINIRQDLTTTTRLAARLLAPPFRRLDRWGAGSVDTWAANSSVTRQRVIDCYHVEPAIIFPTVGLQDGEREAVDRLNPGYVLVVSRLLGYKNVDLVLEAVADRPDLELVVVGDGPQFDSLVESATPNVRLLGRVGDASLRWLYANASVVVAMAYEDFGITPIESARFGCPVVALAWGGYLDTVVAETTGVFVERPEPALLIAAIDDCRARRWDTDDFQAFARSHGPDQFAQSISRWIAGTGGSETIAGPKNQNIKTGAQR